MFDSSAMSYENGWLLASKLCFPPEAMRDSGISLDQSMPAELPALPSMDPVGNSLPGIPPPDSSLQIKKYDKLVAQDGILIPWIPSRLVALSTYFLFLTVAFILIRADKKTN